MQMGEEASELQIFFPVKYPSLLYFLFHVWQWTTLCNTSKGNRGESLGRAYLSSSEILSNQARQNITKITAKHSNVMHALL